MSNVVELALFNFVDLTVQGSFIVLFLWSSIPVYTTAVFEHICIMYLRQHILWGSVGICSLVLSSRNYVCSVFATLVYWLYASAICDSSKTSKNSKCCV